MNKVLIILISFIVCSSSLAQHKKVCVTIDDLPVVSYVKSDHKIRVEITSKLLSTFNQYAIPAIGYVNERKLYTNGLLDNNKVELLRMWLKADYELGNHTFSHHSYHRVDFETFTKDLLRGEEISKPLAMEYGINYRYFRHPYLHIGSTTSSADSLSDFLTTRGYIEAPVTIDTDDYLFAKKYHLAIDKGDTALAAKIGSAYLSHTEKKIAYYEKVSEDLFGRNISHTLLLHASLLNANHLDEIAELFIKHDYVFISQEEVLQDPCYYTQITKYGPWGISWIDRWAISAKKTDLLKSEPEVPGFIR